MNPLYPKLANKTVVKIIKKYGQPCKVYSAADTDYEPGHAPTGGQDSLCVVCNTSRFDRLDSENPIKLEQGQVKILLIAKVPPEKGGAIWAENEKKLYRVFLTEKVCPAGLPVLFKAYATDKDQAVSQLYPVDLNKSASLYLRMMRGTTPDDLGGGSAALQYLNDFPCAIVSKAAIQKSASITLEDGATHVIWCREADLGAAVDQFDTKKHLLRVDGIDYRLIGYENVEQADKTYALSVCQV